MITVDVTNNKKIVTIYTPALQYLYVALTAGRTVWLGALFGWLGSGNGALWQLYIGALEITLTYLLTVKQYHECPWQNNAQYTQPTQRDATVESCRVGGVNTNSQYSSRRQSLPTDSVDNLEIEHSGLTTWILIDVDNFLNSDVITSSLVTNLNSLTVIGWPTQEIVNWVTTADFAVGKFVQTHRNCRQLVANCVHTADATRVGVGGVYWA